jgi:hypothetical protein
MPGNVRDHPFVWLLLPILALLVGLFAWLVPDPLRSSSTSTTNAPATTAVTSPPASDSAGTSESSTTDEVTSTRGQILRQDSRLDVAFGSRADLDHGAIDDNQGYDELFLSNDSDGIRLYADPNAEMSPTVSTRLSYDTCSEATRFTHSISVDDLSVGSVVCFRTAEEHLAGIKILSLPNSQSNPPTLSFKYIVWRWTGG